MHLSFRFSACCRCWRWRTRGGIERNQGNDRTRERANISVFENDDRSKNRGENGEKTARGEIPDNRSVVPLVVESERGMIIGIDQILSWRVYKVTIK